MMMVHPDQADPKCKHSLMIFRAYVQLPLYLDGIDDIINTLMMKTPHNLLVQLAALDNRRKIDIDTLKNYKGDIFS